MDVGAAQVAKRRTFGGATAALVVVALLAGLAAAGIWWLRSVNAQTVERVEHDHGVELPSSTRDVQAMSDIIRFVDHGRSAVFVIDTDELADLIDVLDQLPDVAESTFVPGNAQYQPQVLPWPPDSQPLQTFGKESPAGGDWLHVEIYAIDESSTGIWLYSDWN